MGPFQGTLAGLMLTLGGVLGVSDPPTLGTTWGGGGGLGGGGPSMLLVPIALRLWGPSSGQACTQRLLPAQWVNPSSKNTLKAQVQNIF